MPHHNPVSLRGDLNAILSGPGPRRPAAYRRAPRFPVGGSAGLLAAVAGVGIVLTLLAIRHPSDLDTADRNLPRPSLRGAAQTRDQRQSGLGAMPDGAASSAASALRSVGRTAQMSTDRQDGPPARARRKPAGETVAPNPTSPRATDTQSPDPELARLSNEQAPSAAASQPPERDVALPSQLAHADAPIGPQARPGPQVAVQQTASIPGDAAPGRAQEQARLELRRREALDLIRLLRRQ